MLSTVITKTETTNIIRNQNLFMLRLIDNIFKIKTLFSHIYMNSFILDTFEHLFS